MHGKSVARQSDKTASLPEGVKLRTEGQKIHGAFYKWAIDTSAMVTFFIPVCMANDIFIGGMTVEQSLKARGIGTLMNITTGRIYGKFRDYARKFVGTSDNSSSLRALATDAAALTVFTFPLNTALFFMSGGEAKNFIAWTLSVSTIAVVSGRPYGIYLDWLRKKTGVPTPSQSKPAVTPIQEPASKA
jgi:hypothetical protein